MIDIFEHLLETSLWILVLVTRERSSRVVRVAMLKDHLASNMKLAPTLSLT